MPKEKKILITGVKSGLGKFLAKKFSAYGFSKEDDLSLIMQQALIDPFDVIIHCAFSARRDITSHTLFPYMKDNLLLTQNLALIPHKKFIYASTVEVYPSSMIYANEKSAIPCDQPQSLYGMIKIFNEQIIQNQCMNPLIMRLPAMLGKDSRPNSITRILFEENPSVSLAEESTFNYILHEDVASFIETSLDEGLIGVFNLMAHTNVTLSAIARMCEKKVNFGSYVYKTILPDTRKVLSHWPNCKKSSLENVSLFLDSFTS